MHELQLAEDLFSGRVRSGNVDDLSWGLSVQLTRIRKDQETHLLGHDGLCRDVQCPTDGSSVPAPEFVEDLEILIPEVDLEFDAEFEGCELLVELVVVAPRAGGRARQARRRR